ncbi:MAG: NADH:flavin oxidoreductase/NADH oxidase family protein [Alphaproteobacteria bacterium]
MSDPLDEPAAATAPDQPVTIASPLTLPCGAMLRNRIAKAAMTEGVADCRNHATKRHETLYRTWARGGAGLLITGNIQVDRRYLERPGNVAIERDLADEGFERLSAYARAATQNDTAAWVQLSHAGRQTPARVTGTPVAPSAVRLNLPKSEFGVPRALETAEIEDIRDRFIFAAGQCRKAGFTGVQIHAAHGYLLSEFLSPRVNQRSDDWGGSLRNRARLLMEIIAGIRGEVGAAFPISVKLNSSDFQRGGFAHDDCLQVVQWLNEAGIDLLEISGGTYEQPRMMDTDGIEPVVEKAIRVSTREREAYFLKYAVSIRSVARMPLMVTGGFRSRRGMDAALAAGEVDVCGIARPLCVMPDLPERLFQGSLEEGPAVERSLRLGPGFLGPQSPITFIKLANAFGSQGWFYHQIYRLADGLEPDREFGLFAALRAYQAEESRAAKALEAVGGRAA